MDCSQIFKIDADYLESLIDFDSDLFKKTNKLCDADMCIVVKGLLTCAFIEPPYFSISEVNKGEDGLPKARSLYLCEQKYNDILHKYFDDQNLEEEEQDLCAINLTNLCPQTEEHQNNGWDFAKMIVGYFKKNERYVEAFWDPNVPNPRRPKPLSESKLKEINSRLESIQEKIQRESLWLSWSYQDSEIEPDWNDDVCSNNYWNKDKEDEEEKDKGRGR